MGNILILKKVKNKKEHHKKKGRRQKTAALEIIDYIYPITNLTKKQYEIKDHINLSGFNPLKGPKFIPMNNIYLSKTGIIVCGLKEGTVPNEHEIKIMKKAGIQAYCYNLIPKVIHAASLGIKVKAYGVLIST